eukprot:GHRQ01023841.1.p1 GENE.GHRQ01023841.1~~GHRQ01023841.1.p1  ORF type:complete len:132 (-),score=27.63 GHRQ01023841.1:317-712(-)
MACTLVYGTLLLRHLPVLAAACSATRDYHFQRRLECAAALQFPSDAVMLTFCCKLCCGCCWLVDGAGKGPFKIVKNIPQGLPPVSIQDWVPIGNIRQLLPLAFIVMAVDMLESTSIARALARKNNYRECTR